MDSSTPKFGEWLRAPVSGRLNGRAQSGGSLNGKLVSKPGEEAGHRDEGKMKGQGNVQGACLFGSVDGVESVLQVRPVLTESLGKDVICLGVSDPSFRVVGVRVVPFTSPIHEDGEALVSNPMEGVDDDPSPSLYMAKKWKKLARGSHRQMLGLPASSRKVYCSEEDQEWFSVAGASFSKLFFPGPAISKVGGKRKNDGSWEIDTEGVYIAKSGYLLALRDKLSGAGSSSLSFRRWWLFLWNLSIPPKNIFREEFEFVCVLLWFLWFERNCFLHSGPLKSVEVLLESSAGFLSEFQNILEAVSVK
ncbi:hypothetical protein ACOSQ2_003648 [Xanthoceras sorbifolium]